MKTKDVKEYYTKYMYYYNKYHGYSHDNTKPWEEINGPEPVKTRKVINARV